MSDEVLIRLPSAQVSEFDPEQEQVGLVFANRDAIVLRRVKAMIPGETARDYLRMFGGPRALWAADLFHALNLNHASGLVVFEADGIRREVYMRNGEIIFAQSNQNDDRLGESLIRAGKIDQTQLDTAAKAISATRKLGQILVEDGLITPKELFVGVRRQVEEVVWRLLDWPAKYLFFEGFADPESVVALNLETQKLLIDGIRRTKSWSHIPVDAPDREVVLQLSANPKNLKLNQEERRLASLIVAGISLRDLIEQGGLGDLGTYKVVHHLLQRELILIGVRGQTAVPDKSGTVLPVIASFQQIFDLIFAIVAERDANGTGTLIQRVNGFFDALPDELAPVFNGVRFDEQHQLDGEKIADAVAKLGTQGRARMLKAYNEVLYFTLFESKPVLTEADSRKIMEYIENLELF